MYTADRRLYLTADGKVVEEGDPAATSLLVGEGGQLSDEDAHRYGLVKAQTDPKPNKAKAAPENK